jgi:thioredoxin 1
MKRGMIWRDSGDITPISGRCHEIASSIKIMASVQREMSVMSPENYSDKFADIEPVREDIDALCGPVVLEFGTPWCGYCQEAAPLIRRAFAAHPHILHIKVEDGRGRPLGRSFKIKLWPTLVFLKDGREVRRLVRPDSVQAIDQAMKKIEC